VGWVILRQPPRHFFVKRKMSPRIKAVSALRGKLVGARSRFFKRLFVVAAEFIID